MKTQDLSYESKIKGEEGTLIQIDGLGVNDVYIRWETDDYECGMSLYRKDEDTPWDLRYIDYSLDTWAAEGSFQDYSDDNLWDFVEEGLEILRKNEEKVGS